MKKNATLTGSNAAKLAAVGASLAGLAATSYFFLGPKGKKHQKQTQAWAIKMKRDVVKQMKKARDISEPIYHEIVDSVAETYEKGKGLKATQKEIRALAQDLKKHWKAISSSAQAIKRDVAKGGKKVINRAKR